MLMMLRLLPFVLLTLMQLLALVAMRSGLQQSTISLAVVWPSVVAYVSGAVLCIASLCLALLPRVREAGADSGTALALTLAIGAGAMVMLGPFLWGYAFGEFSLSHHLVRALLVAPSVVLYCWYVTADR